MKLKSNIWVKKMKKLVFQKTKNRDHSLHGKIIESFYGLFSKNKKEPIHFWLKVSQTNWYQFFTNSRLLYWNEFDQFNTNEIQECEKTLLINVGEEHHFVGKKIDYICMVQKQEHNFRCGEFTLVLKNGKKFILQDYVDKKTQFIIK